MINTVLAFHAGVVRVPVKTPAWEAIPASFLAIELKRAREHVIDFHIRFQCSLPLEN